MLATSIRPAARCAWANAPASGRPVAAPQDAHQIGDWTPIRRPDGTLQWAYKGKPVYTFSGDTAAGQTHGAGVGGVWRLLVP